MHNRPIRAPNPESLRENAHQYIGNQEEDNGFNTNHDDIDQGLDADDEGNDSAGADTEDEQPLRLKRHSKTPYGTKRPNPTQLQFYPPRWRDILDKAIDAYALAVFIRLGFTSKEDDLPTAGQCLMEAIAEHDAVGRFVEAGNSYFISMCVIGQSFHCRLLPEIREGNDDAGL